MKYGHLPTNVIVVNSAGDIVLTPIGTGVITLAGPVSNTYTSIASTPAIKLDGTWFTGGSATTTKPHLLIEPTGTTSTGWSTSGTGLGINAAAGFAGNLLDLQVNGTSRVKVSASGSITLTMPGSFRFGQSVGHDIFGDGSSQFRFVGSGDTTLVFGINPMTLGGIAAERIAVQALGETTTITGSYATQRFVNWDSPTITAASALTVTTAIAQQINGPLPAGSATFTNSVALDLPTYATNGTTASGLRIAAPSGAATNWAINVTAGNMNLAGDYYRGGTKVVGAQGATVADASGGTTIDAEARTALNALLARVRAHGLIAT